MAQKNTPDIEDSKLKQILQDMSEQPANSWIDSLAENSRRILELKGKLRRQHALLEESRKREITLQGHMDEWKRDQTELIRLREFVHNLESDYIADEETSAEDRIAFLAENKLLNFRATYCIFRAKRIRCGYQHKGR